jgi:hypothetical protein
MKSNVVHLRKPKTFSPAAALAMARAMIRTGREHHDEALEKRGKELLDRTNAELDGNASSLTGKPIL